MNFTDEMIARAKTAASAEELRKLAAEEGVELAAEEAEQYYSFLAGQGELPDAALEAVAGGKGKPKPKYHEGQYLWRYFRSTVNWMEMQVTSVDFYHEQFGYMYSYRVLNEEGQPVLEDFLENIQVYTYDPRK